MFGAVLSMADEGREVKAFHREANERVDFVSRVGRVVEALDVYHQNLG